MIVIEEPSELDVFVVYERRYDYHNEPRQFKPRVFIPRLSQLLTQRRVDRVKKHKFNEPQKTYTDDGYESIMDG